MMIHLAIDPSTAERSPAAQAVGIRAEFLDFRDRSRGHLRPGEVRTEIDRGRFVWIDIDAATTDADTAAHAFPAAAFPGVDLRRVIREHALPPVESAAGLRRGDGLLHIVFVGGAACGPDSPCERLDVVIGAGFLLTVHRGPNAVLDAVRREYVHDFEHHAATPSFLVYEICNEQVEQFLAVQGRLEEDVEETRRLLAHDAGEPAFESVAAVSGRLLALRRRVLPARRVLEELVSRKTVLVSEATLGFLGGMIDTLERLLADIAADREILESALNLSLTVMSHRTNQTMNRLAVVSTIFLPLTFLCGIYGMNFEVMPEVRWAHGYTYFWTLSAVITAALVMILRRSRLL